MMFLFEYDWGLSDTRGLVLSDTRGLKQPDTRGVGMLNTRGVRQKLFLNSFLVASSSHFFFFFRFRLGESFFS